MRFVFNGKKKMYVFFFLGIVLLAKMLHNESTKKLMFISLCVAKQTRPIKT